MPPFPAFAAFGPLLGLALACLIATGLAIPPPCGVGVRWLERAFGRARA